jgi:ABC-2 type transport system permease protein
MSTGAIHDLGYKRYAGARQDAGTRWRVIMRHQVAMAWKTWWRFKAWLGMAVLISFIAGAIMYTMSSKIFHGLGHVGDVALLVQDVVLPQSIGWYCRAGFITSLTLGATVIAGDVQSGAFTFYFARSVRPRDYVLGKLGGLAVIAACITMIGPVLLAGLRLGLCGSASDVVSHLVLFPKALLVGALATLAYTAVPLGFSALADSRRTALAMWAAYYLVGGTIAIMIGAISHTGWIAALDLPTAIQAVTNRLFGLPIIGPRLSEISLAEGVTSVVVQVAAAIGIVWVTVDRAQKTGVGGAT